MPDWKQIEKAIVAIAKELGDGIIEQNSNSGDTIYVIYEPTHINLTELSKDLEERLGS